MVASHVVWTTAGVVTSTAGAHVQVHGLASTAVVESPSVRVSSAHVWRIRPCASIHMHPIVLVLDFQRLVVLQHVERSSITWHTTTMTIAHTLPPMTARNRLLQVSTVALRAVVLRTIHRTVLRHLGALLLLALLWSAIFIAS